MDHEDTIFNADLWAFKALEDFIAFKNIYEFVRNESAMNVHKNTMNYFVIDSNLHPDNTENALKDAYEKDIINSLIHFAGQTLVSLCTTYEVAAKQFYKCLFLKEPTYMYDFIGESSTKGKVLLNDVINAGDYKKFILETSKRSSLSATKGKYGEILNKAQKLCKTIINEKISKNLNDLQKTRNIIIHEKHLPKLTIEEVGRSHELVVDAIEIFMKLAIKKEIPGRYTYIKPEIFMEIKSFAISKPKNS